VFNSAAPIGNKKATLRGGFLVGFFRRKLFSTLADTHKI